MPEYKIVIKSVDRSVKEKVFEAHCLEDAIEQAYEDDWSPEMGWRETSYDVEVDIVREQCEKVKEEQ